MRSLLPDCACKLTGESQWQQTDDGNGYDASPEEYAEDGPDTTYADGSFYDANEGDDAQWPDADVGAINPLGAATVPSEDQQGIGQ